MHLPVRQARIAVLARRVAAIVAARVRQAAVTAVASVRRAAIAAVHAHRAAVLAAAHAPAEDSAEVRTPVVDSVAEADDQAVEVRADNMFYRVENIPDTQTMQAVVAELLPLVPLQRREKALRYKHLHGQYCCLRAWILLHELLTEHAYLPAAFPLSELTYTEDAFGKPSLSAAVFFSISHTKNAIAVAIDRQPVGIDVEATASAKRLADAHFLERTMSAAERQQIAAAPDPAIAFTELWTRKEALVKARGTGLNELGAIPTLLEQAQDCTILTFHTEDYACSVAMLQEQ